MAHDRYRRRRQASTVAGLGLGVTVFVLIALFALWRIDNPRVERLRMVILDRVVPSFSWASGPLTAASDLVRSFQSYARIYQQNQDLRRELQQMKAWREEAMKLGQENARLLDLNRVRLDPKYTHITGVVMADSGSPFRQTVLLNVGRRDGIIDGWATMDGIGLVGRISGVGESMSRVLLLGDSSSRVAVTVQPSNQRGLVVGDNSNQPPIEFIENPSSVRAGDRVITSGDGGVFPPDLLVGYVVEGRGGRLRVQLAADTPRLEFLRVIRHRPREAIETVGNLVGNPATPRSSGAANGQR